MTRFYLAVVALACVAGVSGALPAQSADSIPPMLLGTFIDDYGGTHTVSRDAWLQGTKARYRIVAWHVEARYLIAQNDSTNPGAGGKWTRIDWVALDGMAPWTWAFCFGAYDAPTREAAEATRVAKPETPRTGCNGFPYSRLKVAEPQ